MLLLILYINFAERHSQKCTGNFQWGHSFIFTSLVDDFRKGLQILALTVFQCVTNILVGFDGQCAGRRWHILQSDFGVAVILDGINLISFPAGNQGNGSSLFPCTAGTSDSVNVVFHVLWHIVVENHIHIVYVNSSGCNVCC